jgi:phage shock protein C
MIYCTYMKKRLERDTETAMVAGVVGGLARYFESDPTLFRILALFFLVATGVFPGLLLYLGSWFVMSKPQKPTADYTIHE